MSDKNLISSLRMANKTSAYLVDEEFEALAEEECLEGEGCSGEVGC